MTGYTLYSTAGAWPEQVKFTPFSRSSFMMVSSIQMCAMIYLHVNAIELSYQTDFPYMALLVGVIRCLRVLK